MNDLTSDIRMLYHIKKVVLSDAGLLGKLKNLKGENITP